MECCSQSQGLQSIVPAMACVQYTCTCVCPQDVPCHAELAAIQKAVQEDCDIWHTRAMQLKRADYKSKIQTDFKENGGKLAFAAIREPASPPVDQIGYDEIFTATVLRLRTKESGVWVKIAEKHDLKLRQQLQSPYGTAFVHKISPRGIQLIGISPERCTFALTRKQWTCQPDLIGKKLQPIGAGFGKEIMMKKTIGRKLLT